MVDYLLNDILNELDLHFRMQSIFQQGNKNRYEFMNTKRIDIFSNYVFYCNLHDIEISIKHFNSLLDLISISLSSKGYETTYNTDENMLHITKRG